MSQIINSNSTSMGSCLDDLCRTLRARMPALRERYGVQWLGVFGSFARSEQRCDSDLDLLVEFDDRPLTLFQFITLEDELSETLGVKVDLVEKSALKPAIGRRVLAEVVSV